MSKYFFCAREFVIVENEMWYVPLGYRYLCCYDLQQRKTTEQFLLPNNQMILCLYESIRVVEDKIIFIPCRADYLLIFYIKEREFEKIPIVPFAERSIGFYANFYYKDWLYFFPRYAIETQNNNMVGLFNTITKEVRYESIPKELLSSLNDTDIVLGRDVVRDRNDLFILDGKSGILRWNLLSNTNMLATVERIETSRKFCTICRLDERLYCFSDEEGNVICYDSGKKQINIVENEVDGFIPKLHNYWDSECFGYSIRYRNVVYFFPSDSNKVMEYDIVERSLKEAKFSFKICENKEKFFRFYCGQFSRPYIINDKLYVWNVWNECLFIIDLITKKVDEVFIDAIVEKQQLIDCYYDHRDERKEGRVWESNLLYADLKTMLSMVLDNDNSYNQTETEGMIGKKIWNRIKTK